MNTPNFRTESDGTFTRTYLHCSGCGVRLCQIARHRVVSQLCGYYCIECQIDMGLEQAAAAEAERKAAEETAAQEAAQQELPPPGQTH